MSDVELSVGRRSGRPRRPAVVLTAALVLFVALSLSGIALLPLFELRRDIRLGLLALGACITAASGTFGLTEIFARRMSAQDLSRLFKGLTFGFVLLTPTIVTLTVLFVPLPGPPRPPENLEGNAVSDGVALSWEPSPDDDRVKEYRLYRGSKLIFFDRALDAKDTRVEAGEEYTYSVVAVGDDWSGKSSATTKVVKVPTSDVALLPPQSLSATVSARSVVLTWQPSTSKPSATYKVLRDGLPIGETAAPTFTDNTVEANKNYQYTVRTYDPATVAEGPDSPAFPVHTPTTASSSQTPGSTGSGTETAPHSGGGTDTTPTTVVQPPGSPKTLRSTASTQTSVSMSWSASTPGSRPLAGYRLYRNGTRHRQFGSQTLSYQDTGLSAGTAYSYFVRAFDADGRESASGPTVQMSTRPATPPPSYPYTTTFNMSLTCVQGCWATDQMTTKLRTVTVNARGEVDIHVTYTNHTDEDINIVFDPEDSLSDTSGHYKPAYAAEGGNGYITVPAFGSTEYTISFDGLSPAPGTKCAFGSDVEQGGVFTIYYADVTVPCQ